jgi:hypothetical protein
LSKKTYQFDFKALELATRKAYCQICEDDTADARTEFFQAVRELTYAIVCVTKSIDRNKFDPEEIAYEYSIYLFERMLTGKFRPKKDPKTLPWTKYISLNVKHVIYTIHKNDTDWQNLLEDFQFFVENANEFLDETVQVDKPLDEQLYKKETSSRVLDALKVFYSVEDVKRMLPLAMELVMSGSRAYSDRVPTDLRAFCITLVSVSKRLASENPRQKKVDQERFLKSSMRSTLFLSAIANSDFFPKELLLTLDIDSLSRLVQVCGGKTIRIPFPEELDSLLCSVVAVSRIIKEGKDIERAIQDTKSSSDFNLSRQINIQEFVSRLVDTFTTFKEDPKSQPLVSMLIDSVRSLEKTVSDVSEKNKTKEALDGLEEALKSIPKLKVEGVQYG